MRKYKLGSFPDHDLQKYRYLKKFALRKHYPQFAVPSISLEVVLVDVPADNSPGLIFTFFGVTDLKVGDLNGGTASAVDIRDISSWQEDGANFQVKDTEGHWFTLNCDDLDVRAQAGSAAAELQLAEAASAAR
jgi:hypothetical protein